MVSAQEAVHSLAITDRAECPPKEDAIETGESTEDDIAMAFDELIHSQSPEDNSIEHDREHGVECTRLGCGRQAALGSSSRPTWSTMMSSSSARAAWSSSHGP